MKTNRFVLVSALLLALLLLTPIVSAITYTSQYPPAQSLTYVNATTYYDIETTYYPYFTTDPTKSLVGSWTGNQWITMPNTVSNQRFNIDLGSAKIIKRIYYENSHTSGVVTDRGAKNFTFWGSNSSSSFAELTYANDTGWTQLTTAASQFDQHVAADQADPKYILVTSNNSYEYYSFKIENNWGSMLYIGVRRIELQTSDELQITSNFTWSPSPGYMGSAISFSDTSSDSPTAWQWNFGDGSGNSTLQNPVHVFKYGGNFTVSLTASNDASSSSISKTVQIIGLMDHDPIVVTNPYYVVYMWERVS